MLSEFDKYIRFRPGAAAKFEDIHD